MKPYRTRDHTAPRPRLGGAPSREPCTRSRWFLWRTHSGKARDAFPALDTEASPPHKRAIVRSRGPGLAFWLGPRTVYWRGLGAGDGRVPQEFLGGERTEAWAGGRSRECRTSRESWRCRQLAVWPLATPDALDRVPGTCRADRVGLGDPWESLQFEKQWFR